MLNRRAYMIAWCVYRCDVNDQSDNRRIIMISYCRLPKINIRKNQSIKQSDTCVKANTINLLIKECTLHYISYESPPIYANIFIFIFFFFSTQYAFKIFYTFLQVFTTVTTPCHFYRNLVVHFLYILDYSIQPPLTGSFS